MANSRSDVMHSAPHQARIGEKLSLWANRNEQRVLVLEVLRDFRVIDVQGEIQELNNRLDELDYRRNALKRQLRHAGGEFMLAIYPWLAVAPFALLVAIRFGAAITAGNRQETTQEAKVTQLPGAP